MPMKCSHTVP